MTQVIKEGDEVIICVPPVDDPTYKYVDQNEEYCRHIGKKFIAGKSMIWNSSTIGPIQCRYINVTDREQLLYPLSWLKSAIFTPRSTGITISRCLICGYPGEAGVSTFACTNPECQNGSGYKWVK